jgi:hypothetical protein
VTDDLLALDARGHGVRAHPGGPRVRLWPEAVDILYGPRRDLPPLTPNWEKRYLTPVGRVREPLALSAVYLLDGRRGDSSAPRIEPLTPAEGLLNLLANVRGEAHPDGDSQRREFELLGRVAREVPMRRVTPSTDPALLDRLCDAILADVSAIRGEAADWRERACTI